jgi:ferric-dicitrate binding protein FerR (iron transport regulator)
VDRVLVDAWRTGELADDGLQRLELALRDPAAARDFLRELHLDLALRRVALAHAERLALVPAPRPVSARSARRRSRRWRLVRGRSPLAAATVLAAALLLAVAWWRLTPPPPVAQLVVNAGTARLGATAVAAGEQRALAVGAVVELPARGWASLLYPDGSVIEVLDGSRVTVGLADGAKRLQLEHGELRAEVRKQPRGKPLLIATPRSETAVLGTRLSVASGAGERVVVEEGRVRVTRRADRAAVEVGAGEAADIPATGTIAVARFPAPPAPPADGSPPPARGLQLWLCADRGVAADAQGRVWQWRDQSPRGASVTQADPEFQPRLAPGAVGGHAAISFDQGDDCLIGTTPWPAFRAYTVAFTLRPTALGSWSQTIGCGWGRFAFHSEAGGGVYAGVGAPGGGIRFTPAELPAGTLRIGAWSRVVVTFGAGMGRFYSGGRLLASKPMPDPEPWEAFHIGRLRPPPQEPSGFAGDLAEVLVYDRVLDDDELEAIDRRARQRLGEAP